MSAQLPPPSPPAGANESWRQIRSLMAIFGAQLQPFYPSAITSSATISVEYGFYLVDASGGAVTLTLPTALAHKGRCFSVKKIDGTSNGVTVMGSETIDNGASAIIATPYTCLTFMSDGATWWIV